MYRSIQLKRMLSAHFACWKLSVYPWKWRRRQGFIRLPLLNYSVWSKKFHRRKLLHSIPFPVWS
jgi:gmd: GDP-mannose 4,6-dehydratase